MANEETSCSGRWQCDENLHYPVAIETCLEYLLWHGVLVVATMVLEEEDVELPIVEILCKTADRIQVVSLVDTVVVSAIDDTFVHHVLVLHIFDTSLDMDVEVWSHHERILGNHHEEKSSFDSIEDELELH